MNPTPPNQDTGWQPIETAPRDGTWIRGRNEDGREATIQFRKFHEFAPPMWFEGDPASDGNWEKHSCFYPTQWTESSNG